MKVAVCIKRYILMDIPGVKSIEEEVLERTIVPRWDIKLHGIFPEREVLSSVYDVPDNLNRFTGEGDESVTLFEF